MTLRTAATRGSTVSADSVRDGNAAPSLARPAWLAARAARISSNATGAPGRRAATTTGVGAALTMIAARAVRTVTCSPAAAPSRPATRAATAVTASRDTAGSTNATSGVSSTVPVHASNVPAPARHAASCMSASRPTTSEVAARCGAGAALRATIGDGGGGVTTGGGTGAATGGAGGATGGEGCGALTGGAGAAGALAITTPGGSSASSPDVGVAGGTSRGTASG